MWQPRFNSKFNTIDFDFKLLWVCFLLLLCVLFWCSPPSVGVQWLRMVYQIALRRHSMPKLLPQLEYINAEYTFYLSIGCLYDARTRVCVPAFHSFCTAWKSIWHIYFRRRFRLIRPYITPKSDFFRRCFWIDGNCVSLFFGVVGVGSCAANIVRDSSTASPTPTTTRFLFGFVSRNQLADGWHFSCSTWRIHKHRKWISSAFIHLKIEVSNHGKR